MEQLCPFIPEAAAVYLVFGALRTLLPGGTSVWLVRLGMESRQIPAEVPSLTHLDRSTESSSCSVSRRLMKLRGSGRQAWI